MFRQIALRGNRPWHGSPRNLQYATISMVICVTGRTALLSLLLTPLWLGGSAGFGGKRKSAVKPAHSKIFFRSGGMGCSSVPPWAGPAPVAPGTHPPHAGSGTGGHLHCVPVGPAVSNPREGSRSAMVFPGGTGVPPVLSGRDGRDARAPCTACRLAHQIVSRRASTPSSATARQSPWLLHRSGLNCFGFAGFEFQATKGTCARIDAPSSQKQVTSGTAR